MLRPRSGASAVLLAVLSAAPASALAPGPAIELNGMDGTARCLRATGAPDELLVQAPRSRDRATDVRHGLELAGTVRLGLQTGCAEGAAGGGRLVVAAPTLQGGRPGVSAQVLPDGPVQRFAVPALASVGSLRVAAGPGGGVALAWVETRRLGTPQDAADLETVRQEQRVRVALGAAGGPLGTPVTVGPTSRQRLVDGGRAGLDLAVAPDGAVLLATAEPRAAQRSEGGTAGDLTRLVLRRAPAGAGFGPPQLLDPNQQDATDPDVSVAADGSALVASSGSSTVGLWAGPADGTLRPTLVLRSRELAALIAQDRGSTGPTGPTGPPEVLVDGDPTAPSVAAGAGGTGVLAYRLGQRGSGALVLGPGAVPGAARTLVAPEPDDGSSDFSFFSFGEDPRRPYPLVDLQDARPQVALAPDGSVAAALVGGLKDDDRTLAVASGTLGDGLGAAVPLVGRARGVTGLAAFLDAAGAPQVAFADEAGVQLDQTRDPDARLGRTALEPDPATLAPAPQAALVLPDRLTVDPFASSPVGVRCQAACDVRVTVDSDFPSIAGAALGAAGTRTLAMRLGDDVPPGKTGRVGLILRVSAPRGQAVRTLRRTVAVRLRPLKPAPALRDVRVRRTGDRVRVTFALPVEAPRYDFTLVVPVRGAPVFAQARRLGGGRFVASLTLPRRPGRSLLLLGSPRTASRAGIERRVRLPTA